MLTNLKLCPFFLCLLFLGVAFGVETEGTTKSYPLPINEMEDVISDWLRGLGFVIQKSALDSGGVELSAVKAKEKWRILIKPHSALASNIQASFTVDDRPDKSQPAKLWTYISEYIRPSRTQYTAKDNGPGQDIPNGVLARIESMVCIKATGKCKDEQFSGFIFKSGGLIISTAHGLEGCSDIRVILYDGRELNGHVVKKDVHRDLTLISINAKLDTFVPLAKGRDLIGMGERIYSVGCPVNLGGTVFSGIVNGPQRRVNDLIYWQVNMKIHPGSSGSPVFDVTGNLVGMVKGRYRGVDSVGFLIPFGTIREFLRDGEK
jgi:serine protease Do